MNDSVDAKLERERGLSTRRMRGMRKLDVSKIENRPSGWHGSYEIFVLCVNQF